MEYIDSSIVEVFFFFFFQFFLFSFMKFVIKMIDYLLSELATRTGSRLGMKHLLFKLSLYLFLAFYTPSVPCAATNSTHERVMEAILKTVGVYRQQESNKAGLHLNKTVSSYCLRSICYGLLASLLLIRCC